MAFHAQTKGDMSANYPELVKAVLAFSTFVSVIFTIVAIASNTWVEATFDYKDGQDKDETAYQGIFTWENSHAIGNLRCSNLSTPQCNLLTSTQACVILMLLAGVGALFVYTLILVGKASLFSPVAVFAHCLTGAQAVLGIMALSIYSAFKSEYYSDDDENQEYATKFSATYEAAWAVLVTATLFSSLTCIGGSVYGALNSPKKMKLEDDYEQERLNA